MKSQLKSEEIVLFFDKIDNFEQKRRVGDSESVDHQGQQKFFYQLDEPEYNNFTKRLDRFDDRRQKKNLFST
eukprot:NP_508322.1 Uncharacterized protein CELE_Y75D11A.1 [Caenorhabditis elegans]